MVKTVDSRVVIWMLELLLKRPHEMTLWSHVFFLWRENDDKMNVENSCSTPKQTEELLWKDMNEENVTAQRPESREM